jgi:glycosyltransferase involved in cell wall biosynthesis
MFIFVIDNDLDHEIVNLQGCGASETLFYNTVSSLSRKIPVTVYNKSLKNTGGLNETGGLAYRDYNSFNETGKVVVFQRFFNEIINFHKRSPDNRYILWSHDYLDNGIKTCFGDYSATYINEYFKANSIKIVAVSNFHRANILSFLPDVEITVIYNALFPAYFPKQLTIKQNEITFASNWWKGLDRVLRIARQLNERCSITLNLLKPSYCIMDTSFLNDCPFVNVIGTIRDKKEYSQIIERSICVLTTSFPETFGCVFAESLYLGTPVIADLVEAGFHEFIDDDYKVDFNNVDQVIEKIIFIKTNDPCVSLRPQFFEREIVKQWEKI